MAKPSSKPVDTATKKPEFKFRTKPVQERSIFESWAVLPPKTRLRISLAITAFAAAGIFASDHLEKLFPAPRDVSKQSPAPPSSSSS